MLSTSSGDVQWDLAPVAVSDNLLTKTLFPFSFFHFPTGNFWHFLPGKLLAPKSLPQSISGETQLKT